MKAGEGAGGSIVDSSVQRIGRVYDKRGRLSKVTSYNSAIGFTVVNEIQYTYKAFGQITKEQQQHGARVNTFSPAVQYGYADGRRSKGSLEVKGVRRL